ncbi:S-layer homology domain-containing protein [Paenibacillus sp. LHD-38]|uniref:S-layer homology domain-containing protein n=1 Tax=Paenibacillus sp. LHD-38 TaxID=3072143 RepID=UPI00280C9FFD|nr:S-layer homology domain-containing protein [Paenibacillus sp. LHD-38]MDQ8738483.1 S-layer homology domain-containing protein [Paenibacillus sp. LHD-38]
MDAGKYYAPFIAFASENGIVKGLGAGKFAPNQDVTREEMAQMIANFMKYAGFSVAEADTRHTFRDDQIISAWALPAIQQLHRYGIINGKPDNQFDAKGKVTRAEVAKVISNLIELSVQ